MGSIYGKPKPIPKDTSPSIQEQIKTLEKRKAYAESRITAFQVKAKECAGKQDRPGAERWLQQVIRQRKELATLCAMLTKLETMQSALEQVTMAHEMARATAEGTRQIRNVNLNADNMDTIMEEAREAIEGVEEITRIIAEPIGSSVDVSVEMDELFAEPVIVLPEVPVQRVTISEVATETERELINLPG